MTDTLEQNISNALTQSGFKQLSHADFKCTLALVPLIMIAMITFPHWVYTRYPDGKMIPTEYTRDLGIIQEMGKVVAILEKETRSLIYIYTK